MKALDLVKPNKEQVKEMDALAKTVLSKIKVKDAIVTLGGSFAKDTWLKDAHDFDIYVQFNLKKYKGKDISKILKRSLKKLNIKMVHGSRDYYQIDLLGKTIEVIPILKISKAEQAVNITDISPLHVKWVKKHKRLSDDIRLAKAFCKAQGLYGAESYIKGLSGYAVEILTVYYGSFEKMLKGVSKWDDKTIIDVEKFYTRGETLKSLNKAKIQCPLIVIDPVQKTRNATVVFGKKNYDKFRRVAKAYLQKKSIEFFVRKNFNVKDLKKIAKGNVLILVEAVPLAGKNDIVGSKLLKIYEFFNRQLAINDFNIIVSGWTWDKKALYWYIFPKKKLSLTKKHFGPPKVSKDRLKAFKSKWESKRLHYQDGYSYVNIRRHFREPQDIFEVLIKDGYVRSRVKKIKTS
ncbi:MAG: nucleotidyltransferase domain-containing protein [archaeon]